MAEKMQMSGMTTRQKITILVFVIVIAIILWQIYDLFVASKSSTAAHVAANATKTSSTVSPTVPQPPPAPQPVRLAKPEPMSQRDIELMKMQQETQAKYLEALNELQMLRVSRQIAETNQAIAAAKLQTVTSEKGIVDLLNPPTPPATPATYAKGLVVPTTGQAPAPTPQPVVAPEPQEINYTVISVSQLQYKWHAVLGYQGNLYNVMVGDVLPPDQSKVIAISRTGVILEKDNVKRKVSLVPII